MGWSWLLPFYKKCLGFREKYSLLSSSPPFFLYPANVSGGLSAASMLPDTLHFMANMEESWFLALELID